MLMVLYTFFMFGVLIKILATENFQTNLNQITILLLKTLPIIHESCRKTVYGNYITFVPNRVT